MLTESHRSKAKAEVNRIALFPSLQFLFCLVLHISYPTLGLRSFGFCTEIIVTVFLIDLYEKDSCSPARKLFYATSARVTIAYIMIREWYLVYFCAIFEAEVHLCSLALLLTYL